jgi:osmotically-inducible protein OsmY
MGITKDVRAAVKAELRFDPLVDATDITVRNIDGIDGVVALNGTVPSYPQYLDISTSAARGPWR